ncbi:hypothetical protein FACS1894188_04260 [Clostridia bacterium]|nr:hypothetical protein FACS1894188_04260 [Clostridia bacterium]
MPPADPVNARDNLDFTPPFPLALPVVIGLLDVIYVLNCLFRGVYLGNFDLVYRPPYSKRKLTKRWR